VLAGQVLPIRFYARPSAIVARELLGALIVSTVGAMRTVGRIVETEAYTGPEDEASHAAERIGRTSRNASMFGRPGRAYVYRIYGVHWCLNVVTDTLDHPAAVLIRAIEPVDGIEAMIVRRGEDVAAARLGSGPGNLARALGIDGDLDGHPLREPPLRIMADEPLPDTAVARGPRIGVTRAIEAPLRFFVADSPSVSAHRRRVRDRSRDPAGA
jgi:DNA-3-methyladenine glycosylase